MTVGYLLQRDSGARAAQNLDFCRLWLIFCNLERSRLIFGAAGPEGGEEPSGAIVLRLIQDPRIANSSSTNALSFSSARTMKRFPSPRCASAIPSKYRSSGSTNTVSFSSAYTTSSRLDGKSDSSVTFRGLRTYQTMSTLSI